MALTSCFGCNEQAGEPWRQVGASLEVLTGQADGANGHGADEQNECPGDVQDAAAAVWFASATMA